MFLEKVEKIEQIEYNENIEFIVGYVFIFAISIIVSVVYLGISNIEREE